MQELTIITGRLGADAKIQETNGQKYIKLLVACDRGHYDTSGNWVDQVMWYNVTLWREIKIDRLKKGALVTAYGTLSPKLYKDKEGTTKIDMSLRADSIRLLVKAAGDSSAESNTAPAPTPSAPPAVAQPVSEYAATSSKEIEDDLPF